mmetsp:Transcript_35017/g.55950  ORF Transcript_35017/g.55950 Transcript_35017/m.55950 type:complete len:108 (+) Transcript_35017:38-361(+)
MHSNFEKRLVMQRFLTLIGERVGVSGHLLSIADIIKASVTVSIAKKGLRSNSAAGGWLNAQSVQALLPCVVLKEAQKDGLHYHCIVQLPGYNQENPRRDSRGTMLRD